MRAIAIALFCSACASEPASVETFVTISRERLFVEDIDVSCGCNQRVLEPGKCNAWSDVAGATCRCGSANTHMTFQVLHNGTSVESAGGSTPVIGNFAGDMVTITRGHNEDVVLLPAEFPPVPSIVDAGPTGISWFAASAATVFLSIGTPFSGEYCREPAGESSVPISFYSDSQSLTITTEDQAPESPIAHVTITSSAHAGISIPE